MLVEELATRVDHAERARNVVVGGVEQVVVDAGSVERPRLVALVAGEADDPVDGDVGDRVEPVEQHGFVVLALDQSGPGEHRLDAGVIAPFTPIVAPVEVGERFGRRPA